MKQIFKPLQWAFIACQLLFILAACQEDHTAPDNTPGNLLRIEITANKPTWQPGTGTSPANTRISDDDTTLGWEAGDKLHGNIWFSIGPLFNPISYQEITITRNTGNNGWDIPEIRIPFDATSCSYKLIYMGTHDPKETTPHFDTPIIRASKNVDDLSTATLTVDEFEHLTNHHLFTGLPAGSTLWLKANEWLGWKPTGLWYSSLPDHFPITVGTDGTAIIYCTAPTKQAASIACTDGSTPNENTQWHDLKPLLPTQNGVSQTINLTLINITPGTTTGID